MQCKGDIVVVDIKQHKSQFKNSNLTITHSAKFFWHCVIDMFKFLNCDLCCFFIYFIVRKVNLKLVLSWNTGYFIRYAWGNHLCNFWFGKVKWFGIYGGLNFGFSHWNGWSSYLAAYDFTWTDSLHCTNIQPLFWYRLLKFRQLLLLSLKWLSTSCHCSRQ